MKLLQMVLMGVGALAPVTMTTTGANRQGVSAPDSGHSSTLMAKLTLLNGASRLVTLEGVGCTRSICSRTHIKGRGEHEAPPATSLDSISFNAIDAIRNTTPNGALFVLKDGTRQQMSLVTDFRVLYFRDASGMSRKLDVAEIKSVEFMPGQ